MERIGEKMKSYRKYIIGTILMTLAFFPMFHVEAKSKTVNSQSELKEALDDSSIDTIVLGSNINTTEKINIMRPVTIDGNHKTMKYVGTFGKSGSYDNTVWGGIYVLQVYKTEATIKNITLTGGNGGLLVNGSKVKLVGRIDVSGNGFGGIELGQGAAVESNAHLELDSSTTIVNTTETPDKPTIWVPEDSTDAVLEINGVEQVLAPDVYISLDDIEKIGNKVENPNTSDSTIIYIILSLFTTVFLYFTTKKKVLS